MHQHRTRTTGGPRRRRLATVAALAGALLVGALAPASAVNTDLGSRVVSDDPANWTPQVMDGSVKGITQIGQRIVAVGDFTRVRQTLSGADLVRNGVFAFDATTGAIDPSFNPNLGNGSANSVDTDGTYVYVGGSFGSVGGSTAIRRVVRLTAGGSPVAGLPVPNSAVNEVVVRGKRLFIGGGFTSVGGTARQGLAALDTGTGSVLANVAVPFTGTYNGGTTSITRMDVDAAGTKLVAVGNFVEVGGQPREQIAVVDVAPTATASVSSWMTDRYSRNLNSCANVFNTFMRDVDISPDGTFFAVNTTGAFAGGGYSGTLCDTAARWEMGTGAGQQPTWVAYTGGDTSYGVAIAGDAIYTGGHFRWMNNSFQGDQAGPGAVPREGIAALDAVNGLPLSWNPGRARGVGAEAFYTTPQGLWMGSDTNLTGGERRQRIAFFPLAGGKAIADVTEPKLPGDLFLAERTSTANSGVLHRINAGGGLVLSGDSGPDWTGTSFVNGGNNADWGSGVPVDSTVPAGTPAQLFATERWAGQNWDLPVDAGRQVKVRLYFANQCGCTEAVGSRVFDVAIDGNVVLDDFDIVASAGNRRGTMREFTVTSDGIIDIDFTNVVENPLINAIEVVDPAVTGGAAAEGRLLRRSVDSAGAPTGAVSTANTAMNWATVRGATVVGGTLYYGAPDGNLYARTFNPTTAALGAARTVDLYDDPEDGARIPFAIANMTGMSYDAATHRLYYTLAGRSELYYRYFTPESEVVGAQTFTAPGPDLSSAAGLVLAGGRMLYGSTADGALRSVPFSAGRPTGDPTVVSADGSWRYRSMFAGPLSAPQNQPPTASFTSSCTDLTCTFTSTSTDSDGSIAATAWNFGDGTTGTGTSVSHPYAAAGTYTVTLTATDDGGAKATSTAQVTVTAAPRNQPPVASFTKSCDELACTFTSTSTDSDGRVATTAWNFGDGTTGTGTSVSHTYAADGTYTVTVTATDDAGARSSSSQSVTVSKTQAAPISFVGAGEAFGNSTQAKVTLPAGVQQGDQLLVLLTLNRGDSVPTAPSAGGTWTSRVDVTGDKGQVRTLVWSRTAVAGDAGRPVTVPLSVRAKYVVTATAYRGAVVDTAVAAAEKVYRAQHTTPTATAGAGSVVVSYWSDKSSTTTGWTAPAGTTERADVASIGSGRVTSMLADQGPTGAAGTVGGLTATADPSSSSLKAVMATIVLRPA